MQMVFIRRIAENKFVLPVQPPQQVGTLRQASHVLFKISAPVSPLPMPLPTREMSPSNKETKMHSRIQTEKLFCSEYCHKDVLYQIEIAQTRNPHYYV